MIKCKMKDFFILQTLKHLNITQSTYINKLTVIVSTCLSVCFITGKITNLC